MMNMDNTEDEERWATPAEIPSHLFDDSNQTTTAPTTTTTKRDNTLWATSITPPPSHHLTPTTNNHILGHHTNNNKTPHTPLIFPPLSPIVQQPHHTLNDTYIHTPYNNTIHHIPTTLTPLHDTFLLQPNYTQYE